MAKSFIDTDLVMPDQDADEVQPSETNAAEEMARRKEQIVEQVADAAEEIERLQMRQNELENARRELRELNRKQHEYEEGKKALIEQLSRQSLLLGKEEVRLTRLLEMVTVSRKDFTDMLKELRSIREDQWSDAGFEEELDDALALLENMRSTYHTSVARLDAQRLDRSGADATAHPAAAWNSASRFGWGFWLKAGIAFSLPLVITMVILAILYGYWV